MEHNETKELRCEAAVVVLGDVGRSPRMCNHAKMLADQGIFVKIFGFFDSVPSSEIMENRNIEIVAIRSPPDLGLLPGVVQLPFKFLWNFFTLFFSLLFFTSFMDLRIILMQNPPALPTMLVCYLISKLKNSSFSIDWHNYMYSILKDKYGLTEKEFLENPVKNSAKIVKFVEKYEGICGKLSDYNLCVSNAMRDDLKDRWNINAMTFYDRPPTWKFRKTELKEVHQLFQRLGEKHDILKGDTVTETIITKEDGDGKIVKKNDRPLVLLSSTSWTADEKFEILLDALAEYDEISQSADLPRILMIITGKGPLKQMYIEEIGMKRLRNVTVLTPWLEANDYPIMLYSADLGISLHTSTSGLDLPMKVVDMFGAKLPVLAKNFSCIEELVKVGKNGYLFDDSKSLLSHITRLASGFPHKCGELSGLKSEIENTPFESWEFMWNKCAKPGARLTILPYQQLRNGQLKSSYGYLIIFGIVSLLIFVFGPILKVAF